ncbi:MAG: HAMP domain-containing protein [Scytolyngbya sp. HA4215-MV1]|nr:HAMP domain-containing protein [Scytolyngbya sp. HA4215-MV1]
MTVSLGILVVSVLALGYWFNHSLEQNMRTEAASFAERVQQDFQRERQDLSNQVELMTAEDDLWEAVQRQDKPVLAQALVPLKASLGLDWVSVVNTGGTILLDAREDRLKQADLLNTDISKSASAGANLTDLLLVQVEKSDQPQALFVANYPIKSERLEGGLIVGRRINDALLQKIAAGSSKQLVALVNHQVIAKTLPNGQDLTFHPAAANTPAIRIEAGGQPYFAKTLVLDGSQGAFSILVLYPVTALEAAKAALWLRLGALLLLGGTIVSRVGFSIGRTIARPIRNLTLMTQQLAQGNLTARIPVMGKDEVAQLSAAFNQMADQLAERGLLSQHIQQLQQTLGDLEKNQEQLIHAEKMSSLGQLVAGVAHEINTPLGVIQASIGNITSALEQTLKELPPLLQTLPPEQLSEFFMLLDWACQPQAMLSSREERQLKRNIEQTLADQGLTQADALADRLSKMGITAALDPILPLLESADALLMLKTAYPLSIVQNNSQNIRLAIEQASRIVHALKNYVRQDVFGVPIYASVTEGIDTVLTIYQNQIKRGIEVEKQYASLPQILCYPEELVQVWSNLISNAIQAMSYQGNLTIVASEKDQSIVVQITDTGSGISPDIKARIFKPFFTTKAMVRALD